MDPQAVIRAVQENAPAVVFINVFLEQIGLPIPAVPTMLLAGSVAAGPGQVAESLAAAVFASLLADCVWYWLGMLFGYRVLNVLCKLSINPGSCVSETETRFIRWGLASLMVAKFIPGFSTVAPPIAGSLRMSFSGFLAAAAAGAALWAGLALVGGWLLHDEVQDVLPVLDQHMGRAAYAAAVLIGIWLGWKLWQKYRFRKLMVVPHITPAELLTALEGPTPPLLLDMRGPTMVAQTQAIPGAVPAEHDSIREAVSDWPKDRLIVTLCACPEDAGAIQAARTLIKAGYLSVRSLRGGYEAWQSAVNRGS